MTGEPAAPMPPAGDAYEWFRRGTELLEQGNPAAAAQLLTWVAELEPNVHSVHEARARALYGAKRFDEAEREFRLLVDRAPNDDFACFGLGLSLWRLRRFPEAADCLSMAVVMRPDRADYTAALTQVRATVNARAAAGLDPVGSSDELTP